MQIVDNRALLLRVRNPERITAIIPKSRELSDNRVLVNWGIDEARVLKNLNIKNVPSPINGRYDWPGLHTPFDHQKTTAAFLTLHKRAFCFNEQGTGKTGSAIWAADYLMKLGKIRRVLVICPLSIMDSAWRADIFKFGMHRTVSIAHGKREKRVEIINSPSEFVIINYDGVAIVRDEILAGGFDLIIVDEATHYKNVRSKRWKILKSIIKEHTWVWMMTGTPAAQSPLDAYGLAKIICPDNVPRFFGAFRDKLMLQITRFKWVARPEATQIVHDTLQPAIRFTKDECLDLPEIIYTNRDVELNPTQRKYYRILKKEMLAIAAGEQVTASNAAVAMNKLLQISCGAVYSDSGETVLFDIGNRFKVLMEVIEESSNKVLVFVPFRHTINLLAEDLQGKYGISTEVIHGGISAGSRTEIFSRFQNTDDPKVLVIQPQAAAHGVTLTAANTIVWWGPVASLETYAQANARVHRSGQKHPCTVVRLQGSPVERHLYSSLDNKENIHAEMVDLYNKVLES